MSDSTVQTLKEMAIQAETMAARFTPGCDLGVALRRLQAAAQDAAAAAALEVGRRIPVRVLPVMGKINGGPARQAGE